MVAPNTRFTETTYAQNFTKLTHNTMNINTNKLQVVVPSGQPLYRTVLNDLKEHNLLNRTIDTVSTVRDKINKTNVVTLTFEL